MAGRILSGNGILSGLTLDDAASDPNYTPEQYESPWDQAVRAAWEKRLAAKPNIQGQVTSSPPFVAADPPLPANSMWGPQPNVTAAHFFGQPNAYQPLTPLWEATPASFRPGTRGWGTIGPGPLFDFDPWRKQAIDGWRGLYDYLKSQRNTGAGATEDSSSPDCQQEWSDARDTCIEELAKPNPSRAITGGYDNVEDCARGHVSERCRGNYYERPRKRTRPYNTD